MKKNMKVDIDDFEGYLLNIERNSKIKLPWTLIEVQNAID